MCVQKTHVRLDPRSLTVRPEVVVYLGGDLVEEVKSLVTVLRGDTE